MKKIKIISMIAGITILFAGFFSACEKEIIKDENVISNEQKIHKYGTPENTFFFYEFAPSVFYWVNNPEVAWTSENQIVLDTGYLFGTVHYDENGKFSMFICTVGGDNCGNAREINNNNETINEGMWCEDLETHVIYVCMNP